MFHFNRIAIRSLNCYVRLYSLGKRCPYDVLRLRRNCTDKEIKEAFIKMSKEYHPDKNKDSKAQERFVNIVEAYNVLGKPSSRAHYDILSRDTQSSYDYKTYTPWNARNTPNYQYQYYQNPQSTQQPKKEKSYYGVTGVKKMPNYMIIVICCGFALVGFVVQLVVIRHSFVIHRDNIIEKSRIAAEELDKVRAAAQENGNEVEEPHTGVTLLDAVIQPEDEVELQTRLMLEKIVNGAKPAAATASLGQTLASEKKL